MLLDMRESQSFIYAFQPGDFITDCLTSIHSSTWQDGCNPGAEKQWD